MILRAYSGIVLFSWLFIYLLVVVLLRKKGRSAIYLFFFSVFYVYICAMLGYVLFPMRFGELYRDVGFNVFERVKPVPYVHLTEAFFRFSALNILLTIPFGFGISFVAKMNWRKIFAAGLLLGISLEGLQLVQGLIVGFTFRFIEVNDVIFNFSGVIIGYFLFRLFKKSFGRLAGGRKLNAFLKYMRDIK